MKTKETRAQKRARQMEAIAAMGKERRDEVKHTPLPWMVHNNIGRKGEIGVVADAAPCIIATMGNAKAWPVEAEANAAFIVQACNSHGELLKACKLVANAATNGDSIEPDFWIINRVREAIARAEGRQE